MRRVYIRHASKQYANGDADIYKHDPGITDIGALRAKMVAKYIIDLWGEPERIIVSPYERTRETAKIMKSVCKTDTPIHIDSDVSEYLGNHRNVPIDVKESTLIHCPPHPETFTELKNRVRLHHDKITKYVKNKNKHKGIIWIVTHGLIIKQIASLIGIKVAKEFPTLSCLSIEDNNKIDGENISKSGIIMFHEENNESDSLEDIEMLSY